MSAGADGRPHVVDGSALNSAFMIKGIGVDGEVANRWDLEARVLNAEGQCTELCQSLELERSQRENEAADLALRVERLEQELLVDRASRSMVDGVNSGSALDAEHAKRFAAFDSALLAEAGEREAMSHRLQQAMGELLKQVEKGLAASQTALYEQSSCLERAISGLMRRVDDVVQRGAIEVTEVAFEGFIRRVDDALASRSAMRANEEATGGYNVARVEPQIRAGVTGRAQGGMISVGTISAAPTPAVVTPAATPPPFASAAAGCMYERTAGVAVAARHPSPSGCLTTPPFGAASPGQAAPRPFPATARASKQVTSPRMPQGNCVKVTANGYDGGARIGVANNGMSPLPRKVGTQAGHHVDPVAQIESAVAKALSTSCGSLTSDALSTSERAVHIGVEGIGGAAAVRGHSPAAVGSVARQGQPWVQEATMSPLKPIPAGRVLAQGLMMGNPASPPKLHRTLHFAGNPSPRGSPRTTLATAQVLPMRQQHTVSSTPSLR
mmetsp:Transcript_107500/g.302568  ORF Transcript_107500/g.302568 Transcript_107500/m.302568 type:complete len:498 (-) Transcript_107500:259-1752(-)